MYLGYKCMGIDIRFCWLWSWGIHRETMKPGECCRCFFDVCLAGPHHWCVHRAQILHTPVLGVNLQPGEEWTTLLGNRCEQLGSGQWKTADSEAFKMAIFFAKWMTKIGIDHPVEVVSRTFVWPLLKRLLVLQVNSVVRLFSLLQKTRKECLESIPKAVRNLLPPTWFLELCHKCCTRASEKFRGFIRFIHELLPGCPFF